MNKKVAFPTFRGAQCAAIRLNAADRSQGYAARKAASLFVFLTLLLACTSSWGQNVPVLTYHFDEARTGQATEETILVPTNVNSTKFGKLFTYSVDGHIVAQPLYVPNVNIPGQGTHNVMYVVTMHDSVYAFDADNYGSGQPLWHVNFLDPAAGITAVPVATQGCTFTGFSEIGIMGTPVIDAITGTIYFSAKTQVASNPQTSPPTYSYHHTIHALDITTGAEKFNGPVAVTASVVNSLGQTVNFTDNALGQCQRPGLLLSNGTLFIPYGSNGCDLNSHGWVIAYSATNLQQQLAVFDTAPTPDPDLTTGSSLWMSGSGIAADGDGKMYISTANGPFDNSANWGDSVLKLDFSGSSITVADSFTPFDQNNMAVQDLDLGSGGVTLLPDQAGVYPHEMITGDKSGNLYIINRDGLGGYNPALSSNSNIVQYLPKAVGNFKSVPVYWSGNNRVYIAARSTPIYAFQLVNGMFSPTTPVAQSQTYAQLGVPVISSNGNQGGILWNIHNTATPILSALDATSLVEIYNSNLKGTRDTLGIVDHFVSPVIANNKVFVGTETGLTAYGVFPYLALLGGDAQSAAAGSPLPNPLTVQVVNSQGTGIQGLSVTFSQNGTNGSFNPKIAVTDSNGVATSIYTTPVKAGPIGITAAVTSATGFRNVLMTATGTSGPASVIAKTAGVNQSANAGTTLPIPYTVALRDAHGNGIVGQQLTFTDNGAGGTFSANSVTTGAAGVASVTYTLPTKAMYIILNANYGALTAASAEHSVPGPASIDSVKSGNNQTGKVNTKLKLLVVLVTDQFGNAISGANVTFSDNGAGGSFSSTTAVTNLGGQANVTYTLPATPKSITITGGVSGIAPATFSETATQ